MVRILGNNLVPKKKIYIGLSRSKLILKKLNIDNNTIVENLTKKNISNIRDLLENEFKLEGDLKRKIALNIKHLIETNSFKGKRHLNGLPVRGQRTRTNSRTSRKLILISYNK
jgi:small subunit ribosomal protein S13